jgi:hypothetical protein
MEKTDAHGTGEVQSDDQQKYPRISYGRDLQADAQEVRQEEGGPASRGGVPVERQAQQEVRIDGAVRAVFHQVLDTAYGYIVVRIPDHWEAYSFTYHPEDKRNQFFVNVRRIG